MTPKPGSGPAVAGAFGVAAHAGCLSFEFSTGNQRLVVNCGISHNEPRWRSALRATAAHSTLTLADRSMATVMTGRLTPLENSFHIVEHQQTAMRPQTLDQQGETLVEAWGQTCGALIHK